MDGRRAEKAMTSGSVALRSLKGLHSYVWILRIRREKACNYFEMSA